MLLSEVFCIRVVYIKNVYFEAVMILKTFFLSSSAIFFYSSFSTKYVYTKDTILGLFMVILIPSHV